MKMIVGEEIHESRTLSGSRYFMDSKGQIWKRSYLDWVSYPHPITFEKYAECQGYAQKVNQSGEPFGNKKHFDTYKDTLHSIKGTFDEK